MGTKEDWRLILVVIVLIVLMNYCADWLGTGPLGRRRW